MLSGLNLEVAKGYQRSHERRNFIFLNIKEEFTRYLVEHTTGASKYLLLCRGKLHVHNQFGKKLRRQEARFK
jgi:hypothetical protein